jgi:putative SOS response-associated peptidase YedK
MVVILPEDSYSAWLDAPANQSMEFMQACPAGMLEVQAKSNSEI